MLAGPLCPSAVLRFERERPVLHEPLKCAKLRRRSQGADPLPQSEGRTIEDADFPGKGILWRGWDKATLGFIADKGWPVLLFVADRDPTISPFLRELLRAMPKNAQLRALLGEHFPALLIEADAVPQELAMLGAGSTYHVAVLSPSGLTPMVTIDPVHGNPDEIVDEIVQILERLVGGWAPKS